MGNPEYPDSQAVHLVPTTFDLQLQIPLELHVVEEDPEELHPHAEKDSNILNNFSIIQSLQCFTFAVGKTKIVLLTSCTLGANNIWFTTANSTRAACCWRWSRRVTSTCWKRFKYSQWFLKNLTFDMFYLGRLNDFLGQKYLKLKLRSAFIPTWSWFFIKNVGLQWYQWIPWFL